MALRYHLDSPMPETLQPEEPLGPKASVILIGYNQAAELRRALEALERAAGRERFEVLVVDCASRDESGKLDEQYPGVTVLRLPHRFGATKAMNIAARTAKTDFLFYLSPQVEVESGIVIVLTERLESQSDASAVAPLLVDSDRQPVSLVQPLPGPDSLARICAGERPEGSSPDLAQESIAAPYLGRDALMVRKQFVAGMNFFDERFGEFGADADLAIKIHKAGKKIRLYPGIRAVWHPSSRPAERDPLSDADRILGSAQLIGKHYGSFSGMIFRLGATLKAALRFDFGRLKLLIGGQKIDGSQAV